MSALGPDGSSRPVTRASGWRLQTLDTTGVVHAGTSALPPLAEAHSLDWRWLTRPLNDGPGESWITPTVDLVKGGTMTPLERLFAVADDANGIGTKLDPGSGRSSTPTSSCTSPDPHGNWIGIRAVTSNGPDGIGTTTGTLFGRDGPVGATQQSVLARPRPPC